MLVTTLGEKTHPFVQLLLCSIHSHICYLISRLEQALKKKAEPDLLDILFFQSKC